MTDRYHHQHFSTTTAAADHSLFTVSYVYHCLFVSLVVCDDEEGWYEVWRRGRGSVCFDSIPYQEDILKGKEGHRRCHQRTPLVLHSRSTTPKLQRHMARFVDHAKRRPPTYTIGTTQVHDANAAARAGELGICLNPQVQVYLHYYLAIVI